VAAVAEALPSHANDHAGEPAGGAEREQPVETERARFLTKIEHHIGAAERHQDEQHPRHRDAPVIAGGGREPFTLAVAPLRGAGKADMDGLTKEHGADHCRRAKA
jgi:hypothetical protein